MLTITLSVSVLLGVALLSLSSTATANHNGDQSPIPMAAAVPQPAQSNQKDPNNSGPNSAQAASDRGSLEPRVNNFVRDILDRLHALDNDIGKLLVNSTSMYSPNDDSVIAFRENSNSGAQFSEILVDLDALQDELGVLLTNASRNHQYNMLVRLRPLNNIVYRIRHNLHLMRNSLAAINTVSRIEKIGNSVLDSTLSAFLQPDAGEEFIDGGNYDINLDNKDDLAAIEGAARASTKPSPEASSSTTTSTTTTTTTATSTTSTTTTTQKPEIIIKQANSTSSSPTRQQKTTPKPSVEAKNTTRRAQPQRRPTSLKPGSSEGMFAQPELDID